MKNYESSENTLGARVGARLVVALLLACAAGAYLYWQKQREAPRVLTATEQTIQEQLNQEQQQNAENQSAQSASVLLAFSSVTAKGGSEEANISATEHQALVSELNRILKDQQFARETLDALGDTQGVGGARPLDSQNLWVIKGEPYQIAAKKLANALSATGNPDSNLIKLSLNSERPAKLKEVLNLHANRLVQKWRVNRDLARSELSNLLAEKEGMELEVANAVSLEKAALTKSLQATEYPVDLTAMKNQRQSLIEKIKVLETESQRSKPNSGSTAYSTHSHRVLINRLQDQQAYLQTQSNQAEGNPEIKAVIDTELKKVSSQMAQLIEQERQTQSLAEGLADTQQIDSNLKKLKALRMDLADLDNKIKKVDSSLQSNPRLKNKTEKLFQQIEAVDSKLNATARLPQLRFSLELYRR